MKDAGGWFPVALAADIEPGVPTGTRLFGRELVMWRDASGQAHVWEDRCPHRGMRLSFGFVRGGRLACLYHGWQFDAAGRCRHIPAHPELRVPGTIRAPARAAAEWMGLLWTGAGGGVPTDGLPGADAITVPVRSLALRVPASQAFAGLASGPAPFPDAGAVQAERSGPLVSLDAGGHRWIAAVQPVSETECTLHLAIVGAPELYSGAGQAQISAWGEALRRSVEAP